MSSLLIGVDAVPPQPWRNGGGVTRELLAWPPGADWRVRVADIEREGPFSAWPGVQRWFAVLQGAGVELHFGADTRRVVAAGEPLHFDGAEAPGCTLVEGATRDLNLMLRGAAGAMRRVADGETWVPQAAMCGLYTTVAGRCEAAGHAHELPAGALLWFDAAPARLVFTATEAGAAAAGWWIAATPEGHPA